MGVSGRYMPCLAVFLWIAATMVSAEGPEMSSNDLVVAFVDEGARNPASQGESEEAEAELGAGQGSDAPKPWGYLVPNSDQSVCPEGYAKAVTVKSESLVESEWDGSSVCSGEAAELPSSVGYLLADDSRNDCPEGTEFQGLVNGDFIEDSTWDGATICHGDAEVPSTIDYGYLIKGLDKEGCRPGFVFAGWVKGEAVQGDWDGASICFGKPQVDCQLGQWSEYGSCSKECGGGKQSRSRAIEQEPRNGGAACGDTSEERECNTQGCVVEGVDEQDQNNDDQDQNNMHDAEDGAANESPSERAAAEAKKKSLKDNVELALQEKDAAQRKYDAIKLSYDDAITKTRDARTAADKTANAMTSAEIEAKDQELKYGQAKKAYDAAKEAADKASGLREDAEEALKGESAKEKDAALAATTVTMKEAAEKQLKDVRLPEVVDAEEKAQEAAAAAHQEAESKKVVFETKQSAYNDEKQALDDANREALKAERREATAQADLNSAPTAASTQLAVKTAAASAANEAKLAVDSLEADVKAAESVSEGAEKRKTDERESLAEKQGSMQTAQDAYDAANKVVADEKLKIPGLDAAIDKAKGVVSEAEAKLTEATEKHDDAAKGAAAQNELVTKLGDDGSGEIGTATTAVNTWKAQEQTKEASLKEANTAQEPLTKSKEEADTAAALAVAQATAAAEAALKKAVELQKQVDQLAANEKSTRTQVEGSLPKKIEEGEKTVTSLTGKAETAGEKVDEDKKTISDEEILHTKAKLAAGEAAEVKKSEEAALKEQNKIYETVNAPAVAAGTVLKQEKKKFAAAETSANRAEHKKEKATEAVNQAEADYTSSENAEKDASKHAEEMISRESTADGEYQSAAGALVTAQESLSKSETNLDAATATKDAIESKIDIAKSSERDADTEKESRGKRGRSSQEEDRTECKAPGRYQCS